MTEINPQRMPSFLIKQLSQELVRRGEARLRPFGFGFSTLPVLVALKRGEATTQAGLARLLKVEQPSMAQTLARMERDGLIVRRPDPAHGRNRLVALTEVADRHLLQARDLLAEDNAAATADFTSQELETLIELLERMNANLRRGAEG